jgi:hypothetical protein
MSKFPKAYFLLFLVISVFLHYARLYVIIPAWKTLGRMPEWQDHYAMQGSKQAFFSGFWDEWLFVWAHFLLPVFFLFAIILWISIRKEKFSIYWLLLVLTIILIETAFRYTGAYDYVMAD